MNYLKLYENFKEYEFYHKVSDIEAKNYFNQHKTEYFTNNQLLIIKNILSPIINDKYKFSNDNPWTFVLEYQSYIEFSPKNLYYSYTVRKMEDEIYYVRHFIDLNPSYNNDGNRNLPLDNYNYREDYYLCDQFDGLIKFICEKIK
mgnify:CR=1 FL=1